MIKYLTILAILTANTFQQEQSIFENNVTINVTVYKQDNKLLAACLPQIKPESELIAFERRFSYLLMNIPDIHQPKRAPERKKINDLYPDTATIKRLFMEEYLKDEKLIKYFEQTYTPIHDPSFKTDKTYTVDELMKVASTFFYCDLVKPDSSIQAHVCIGLNGISEANWEKDYTLLEAFCYEAIFYGIMDNEDSEIWDTFSLEKKKATEYYRVNITSLDEYLENVKLDVFKRMNNSEILKKELLAYYNLNKDNLAFKIKN